MEALKAEAILAAKESRAEKKKNQQQRAKSVSSSLETPWEQRKKQTGPIFPPDPNLKANNEQYLVANAN